MLGPRRSPHGTIRSLPAGAWASACGTAGDVEKPVLIGIALFVVFLLLFWFLPSSSPSSDRRVREATFASCYVELTTHLGPVLTEREIDRCRRMADQAARHD